MIIKTIIRLIFDIAWVLGVAWAIKAYKTTKNKKLKGVLGAGIILLAIAVFALVMICSYFAIIAYLKGQLWLSIELALVAIVQVFLLILPYSFYKEKVLDTISEEYQKAKNEEKKK